MCQRADLNRLFSLSSPLSALVPCTQLRVYRGQNSKESITPVENSEMFFVRVTFVLIYNQILQLMLTAQISHFCRCRLSSASYQFTPSHEPWRLFVMNVIRLFLLTGNENLLAHVH